MDVDAIPGLSEVLFEQLERVFPVEGEPIGVSDSDQSCQSVSVSLEVEHDTSVEDRQITFFGGNPCCKVGPKKSACWKHLSSDVLLHERQESTSHKLSHLS